MCLAVQAGRQCAWVHVSLCPGNVGPGKCLQNICIILCWLYPSQFRKIKSFDQISKKAKIEMVNHKCYIVTKRILLAFYSVNKCFIVLKFSVFEFSY